MSAEDHTLEWKTGGASRDRTDDPLLAKQVLSQLSYGPKLILRSKIDVERTISCKATCEALSNAVHDTRFSRAEKRWWAWVDSNYRPHPYQGCALTN